MGISRILELFSNWKFCGNGSQGRWTSQFKGTMDPAHTPSGESNLGHLLRIQRPRVKGSGLTAGGGASGAHGGGAHQSRPEWHSDGRSSPQRA
jgi:hypothetical protein